MSQQMDDACSRYSRHVLLDVIGPEGQSKIRSARVLVTGQGALGSLISMLLTRAGVGFLRIVDKDYPEIHNLHRQLLFDDHDVASGLPKAVVARNHLLRSAPFVEIHPIHAEIDSQNIDRLLDSIYVIIDAVDNTATRYVVNDSALSHGIPYVFGGVVETAGNVMTILPGKTPCLRCLWPEPEQVAKHQTASTVGVLSSVATLIASIQVTEALKIIVGDTKNVISGILTIDAWRNHWQVVVLNRDPECICSRF